MAKPVVLDLFCGAGGAAMGYHRAGFEVIGVDIKPQPRYPFTFLQADALDFLGAVVRSMDFPVPSRIRAIHASPPCQAYSVANNIHGRTDHPMMIPEVRELLQATGLPYVIENVPRAPLIDPVVVCGRALGMGVKRHRLFECSFPAEGTVCPKGHPGDWVSVFGHTVLSRGHVIGKAKGGGNRIKRTHLGTDVGREAMGIPWMNRNELSEAIPPAYTEFIGRQLLASMQQSQIEEAA